MRAKKKMRKFFKFGKKDKQGGSETSSLRRGSTGSLGIGYAVKEKDLGKLHKAALYGDLNKVKQLAKKDASPLDKDNRTPLHFAVCHGHSLIVQELLEWKAKVNIADSEAGRTPLIKAVECCQEECVLLMLEAKANPNLKDSQGDAALHYAARSGNEDIIKMLLDCDKTDPDIQNKLGETPLHFAVVNRRIIVSRVLLEEGGCNPDIPDDDGKTPLMLACQEGQTDLVKVLLTHQANTQLKDNRGWTADDVALMSSQDACRSLITDHNNKSGIRSTPSTLSSAAGDGSTEIPPKGAERKGNNPAAGLGLPAVDIEDESSEATLSKSEAAALDTWADSDEDSELNLRKKKLPVLDLSKIQQKSEENVGDTGIKKVSNLEANVKQASTNQRAETEEASGGLNLLSARSTTSARSALSFGADKSEWSDDDSVLSSPHEAKKPSLAQLHQQRQSDDWQKDVVPPERRNEPVKKNSLNISYEEENVSLKATSSSPTKMSPEKHKTKAPSGALMQELGLCDDVSDVSDPDLSEASTPGKDSDWDSTVASDLPLTPKSGVIIAMNGLIRTPEVPGTPVEAIVEEDEAFGVLDKQVAGQKVAGQKVAEASATSHTTRVTADGVTVDEMLIVTKEMFEKKESESEWDSETDLLSSNPKTPPPAVNQTIAPPLPVSPPPSNQKSLMYGMEEEEEEEEESSWERERIIQKEKEEEKRRNEEEKRRMEELLRREAEEQLQKEQKQRELTSIRDTKAVHLESLQRQEQVLPQQPSSDDEEEEEEEDTFHNLHDTDMETPRRDLLPPTGRPPLPHDDDDDDDDGLSYSSTEFEASVHEGHSAATSHLQQLSLSINSDSASVLRLQEQSREVHRKLERERSTRASLEHRRRGLEKEKAEVIQKLEDVTRTKSALEQNKIDLEAKIRSMQYQLNQEEDKRKNAELLYQKVKEQLSRKDDQYTKEVESKQQMELNMRNLQMELRSLKSSSKQMLDEKEHLLKQLSHEQNARLLQEQITEERSNSAEVAAPSNVEAQARLDLVDEDKKAAKDSIEWLNAELKALQMERDRWRVRAKEDHDVLSSENDQLQRKVEELTNDIRLSDDALGQVTTNLNVELQQLQKENSRLTSEMEKERNAKDALQAEIDSLKNRLSINLAELDQAQEVRKELERRLLAEQDEWKMVVAKRDEQISKVNDGKELNHVRLQEIESNLIKTENELHISNATLLERSNQLNMLQREVEQKRSQQEAAEESLRKEKEQTVMLQTKMESMQERVSDLQHQSLTLKQELDEERIRSSALKEDAPEKLSLMMQSMQTENERVKSSFEERNRSLQDNVQRLQDDLRAAESRRAGMEHEMRQLQSELAEANRKLSAAESALQVANTSKNHVEHEHTRLTSEIVKLTSKLENAKERRLELQQRISELTDRAEKAENSTMMAASMQQMTPSAKSKADLEETLHKLELENTKLDSALKHEEQKVLMLQKDLHNSNKVKESMQDEVEELRILTAKLKFKMDEAAATRTLATQDAQDSKNLWESEVKSRSKLGLRIAQLEREKQETLAQVNEERRKVRKALELKKAADAKLDQEQQESCRLQKEITAMRAHLKAAKKRLKLEDAQIQLQTEVNSRVQLQGKSQQLQGELANLQTAEKSFANLEKSKRILENDLQSYKTQFAGQILSVEDLERYRAEIEARSRLELNQKLEAVNQFLQKQREDQEVIDRLRDETEKEMRKDFEKHKKDLAEKLDETRGSVTGTQKERIEEEARHFKNLYESEIKLRERLAARLARANDKASQAQMLIERQRQSPYAGSADWLLSNNSSLRKSPSNHGVNDINLKIRQELDRSIAKHMEKAPLLNISLPSRSSNDASFTALSASSYMDTLKTKYFV